MVVMLSSPNFPKGWMVMKTTTKEKGLLKKMIGCVALLLLLLPAGALAEKIKDLWVTGLVPGQEQGEAMQGEAPDPAVHWWYSSKERKYYLFLPAGTDAGALHLWFDKSADSVSIDGKKIQSGDAAPFLTPGKEIVLLCGKTRHTLAVMQSKNVPALFVTTESGSLKKIHANKKNQEPGTLVMLNADGSLEYEGLLTQVKGRGNSTFALNKKPYQIKLDKSTDLCGMGKSKTWVLLANFHDNSLIRNSIAFALADAVGLEYTSRFQQTDLYINQEYYGTYLLCEKVEVGNARVDIRDLEEETEELNGQKLEDFRRFGSNSYGINKIKGFEIPKDPDDITGGYLMELDYKMRYKNEVSGFVTKRGQAVVLKSPEYASKAQVEYIRDFMQGFENAIFSSGGIDSKSGKHYSEFVDMPSLLKKYLLEEILKNYDANRSSLFFYKPADEQSPLAMAGPAWDYDSSIGNYGNERNQDTRQPEQISVGTDGAEPFYWLTALYKQPDFKAAAIKMYYEEFVPVLEHILGQGSNAFSSTPTIDSLVDEVEASAAMNFTRWPVFNIQARPVKTGANYKENIDYVRNFLKERMEFLADTWK